MKVLLKGMMIAVVLSAAGCSGRNGNLVELVEGLDLDPTTEELATTAASEFSGLNLDETLIVGIEARDAWDSNSWTEDAEMPTTGTAVYAGAAVLEVSGYVPGDLRFLANGTTVIIADFAKAKMDGVAGDFYEKTNLEIYDFGATPTISRVAAEPIDGGFTMSFQPSASAMSVRSRINPASTSSSA